MKLAFDSQYKIVTLSLLACLFSGLDLGLGLGYKDH